MYTYLMPQAPYILGLTGTIASGKSVVRQFLDNSGALTIDADLLAQEIYLPGQPAYQPILERFGHDLLSADGQINRSKLGRIVFKNPQAMQALEGLIYPHIPDAIAAVTSRSQSPLVVLEAIRLLNEHMHLPLDQIWAASAPAELRAARLTNTRGLSEADAWERIHAQLPQEQIEAQANRIIDTSASFQNTYAQVQDGLKGLPHLPGFSMSVGSEQELRPLSEPDFAALSLFINQDQPPNPDAPYRLVGSASALGLFEAGQLKGIAVWSSNHSLSIFRYFAPGPPPRELLPPILKAITQIEAKKSGQALLVPATILPAAVARKLGFRLGDPAPDCVHPAAYNNFLRRYGKMPGEVYLSGL